MSQLFIFILENLFFLQGVNCKFGFWSFDLVEQVPARLASTFTILHCWYHLKKKYIKHFWKDKFISQLQISDVQHFVDFSYSFQAVQFLYLLVPIFFCVRLNLFCMRWGSGLFSFHCDSFIRIITSCYCLGHGIICFDWIICFDMLVMFTNKALAWFLAQIW